MTSDPKAFAGGFGPRQAIHQYMARVALQQRQLGLVPLNGRWMTVEARAQRVGKGRAAGRVILAELVLLFLALAGCSLLLLLLTYYLAY